MLIDDGVNLDDGLGLAGPSEVARNSWMHTVMGRRAAEMLIRLERSYIQLVDEETTNERFVSVMSLQTHSAKHAR